MERMDRAALGLVLALGVEGDRLAAAASARRGERRAASPRSSRRRPPTDQLPASGRSPARARVARTPRPGRARGLAEPAPGRIRQRQRRGEAADRERRGARQDPDRARIEGARVSGGVLPVRLGRTRCRAAQGCGGHRVSPGCGRELPRGHRSGPGRAVGIDRAAGGVCRIRAAPLRGAHAGEVPMRGRVGAGARGGALAAGVVAASGAERQEGRHPRRFGGGEGLGRPGGGGFRCRGVGCRNWRGRRGFRRERPGLDRNTAARRAVRSGFWRGRPGFDPWRGRGARWRG